MLQEERLELADIQGAIVPGFRKDHSALIGIRIKDRAGCKAWLRARAGEVSRADEVLAFNRLFKRMKARRGSEAHTPKAVWLGLNFSHDGLVLLRSRKEIQNAFEDPFQDGMFQSSLDDAPAADWIIGGTASRVPHILLVVAADDPKELAAEVKRLRVTITSAKNGSRRALQLMTPLQFGDTLPGALRGHEHFGFKDGISQPAIRGVASADPGDFIDARKLAPDDANFDLYAEPGRVLVWPGQFVIGYNRQDGLELTTPRPPMTPKLPWQRNGSYLVYRRLRQHAHLFWDFCTKQAQRLSRPDRTVTPVAFASLLVGRWPSGAPIVRTPKADDPALAADDTVNNDFLFSEVTPIVRLASGGTAGGTFPAATPDPNGLTCPFPAHIRKVNPRDDPSDTSGPRNTKTRLMLRRGIPYGPPPATPQPLEDDGRDRGLLFMSYQASIENQFEFVTRTWVNRANSPHDSTPTTGHDPLIGQGSGVRFLRCALEDAQIDLPAAPWVVMTGGGYFFTPSISAIAKVLAAD